MAPSSSNAPLDRRAAARVDVALDRAALAGLAVGLALYVMPWWSEGRLRWAFWVTFVSTLTNVWATHRKGASSSGSAAGGLNGAAPVRADVEPGTPG